MSLCSQSDVEKWMSLAGLASSSSEVAPYGALDSDVLAFFIEDAEQEFMYYAAAKYDQADLAGNVWVKHTVAFMVARTLSIRLGRPVPESWDKHWERLESRLDTIRIGSGIIPEAPMRRTQAPTMVNNRVDDRFRTMRGRTETTISVSPPDGRPVLDDPDNYLATF